MEEQKSQAAERTPEEVAWNQEFAGDKRSSLGSDLRDLLVFAARLPSALIQAPLNMVHLFATEAKGLAAKLRCYRGAIEPDGMIWVSWPKKASGVATDLTENVLRDTALPLGLVDIKVCAIDDTWSGLKFVIPKDQRAKRLK